MGTDEGALRKATLREQLTARRKALSPELVDTRGLKIQARFLATPYYHEARTVARRALDDAERLAKSAVQTEARSLLDRLADAPAAQ